MASETAHDLFTHALARLLHRSYAEGLTVLEADDIRDAVMDAKDAYGTAIERAERAERKLREERAVDAANRAVCDTLHARVAVLQAECAAGGWVVGDGNGLWRTWNDAGPCWTTNRDEAIRYARREDAERVHAEDEEAWTVQPYRAATDAAGAMGDTEVGRG